MVFIKGYFLVIVVFLFYSARLNAQKNVENQQVLWFRYNANLKFNEHYKLKYELEERTYFSPWRQHQFTTRALVERTLSTNWSLSGGLIYMNHALPNTPDISVTSTQQELRPVIDFENKQKLNSKFGLSHKYSTEFRFFEQPDNSFEFTNLRLRYKLELNYKPFDKVTLKAFDEILLNVGNQIVQNVFDQNRIGGSVQVMPSKSLGFELGYFNWFQQRKSGSDFYNRDIIRFTIHQNIIINTKNK